jgi:dephospho-CoA kinase
MLWIGLSGGIGTGKSTVAAYLRSLGYPVADADSLAHQALEPGQESWRQVVQAFGPELLQKSSQEIDRKKLAQIVFKDPSKMIQLEKIIHPYVQSKVALLRAEWSSQGHSMAFYDVPLLFEKNLEDQFEKTLFVYSAPEIQLERIKKRNPWSDQEIKERLSHQLPLDSKKERANFVVDNSTSEVRTREQVDKILVQLKGTSP